MASTRSLQVHPHYLKTVKLRFQQRYECTQAAYADLRCCSRETISKFFNGKPIDRATFHQICTDLDLIPAEIIEANPEISDSPPSPTPSSPVFTCIPAAEEIRWVGREALVQALAQRLQGDCRIVNLLGLTGIGKTALGLKLWEDLAPHFEQVLALSFDTAQPGINQLLQPILGRSISADDDPKVQAQTLIPDLIQTLQTTPHLLLLDMVEVLLHPGLGGQEFQDPIFGDFFDQVVKIDPFPSRIILTSQEQPPPPAEGRYPQHVHLEALSGLTVSESLDLFREWDVYPENDLETDYLDRISRTFEGHPLALRVMAGEMRDPPYGGQVSTYWQEIRTEVEDFEQLKAEISQDLSKNWPNLGGLSLGLTDLVQRRVEKSIRRLWQQDWLAGVMLGQGAVAYRQAVEQEAWLVMAEEYTEDRAKQRQAFQTLQRRYLLEREQMVGYSGYRLHSLVRRVAVDVMQKKEQELEEWEEMLQEQEEETGESE